jgi:hypothetical protein
MRSFERWPCVVLATALCALFLAACGTASFDDLASPLREAESTLSTGDLGLRPIPVSVEIDDKGRLQKLFDLDVRAIDDALENVLGRRLLTGWELMSAEQVASLVEADIQHVTVASRGDGLFLLVNGKAMPAIAWDAERVSSLVDVLGQFQDDGNGAYLLQPAAYTVVRQALPAIQRVGFRIDLRFPRGDSERVIALPDDAAFAPAKTVVAGDGSPEREGRELGISVRYVADGEGWVPTVMGFALSDASLFDESVDSGSADLRLRDDLRKRLIAKGIRRIDVEARADGLFVEVDGRALPYLAWDETTLRNLSDAVELLYPDDEDIPADRGWLRTVRDTGPRWSQLSMALTVHFPER